MYPTECPDPGRDRRPGGESQDRVRQWNRSRGDRNPPVSDKGGSVSPTSRVRSVRGRDDPDTGGGGTFGVVTGPGRWGSQRTHRGYPYRSPRVLPPCLPTSPPRKGRFLGLTRFQLPTE